MSKKLMHLDEHAQTGVLLKELNKKLVAWETISRYDEIKKRKMMKYNAYIRSMLEDVMFHECQYECVDLDQFKSYGNTYFGENK